MPVKHTIPHSSGIFFITFTCYQWLPLIDTVNGDDIIYNWFDHLKSKVILSMDMLLCPTMCMH
ncbi:MAG: hypothetical protein QM791_16840 [Ferruginibacter sp.]